MAICTASLRDRLISHYESKIKTYRNNLLSGQPKGDMIGELNERIEKAEHSITALQTRSMA